MLLPSEQLPNFENLEARTFMSVETQACCSRMLRFAWCFQSFHLIRVLFWFTRKEQACTRCQPWIETDVTHTVEQAQVNLLPDKNMYPCQERIQHIPHGIQLLLPANHTGRCLHFGQTSSTATAKQMAPCDHSARASEHTRKWCHG